MSASLSVREVSVRFGGDFVLRDVNLQVGPGLLHGLIGPNGAGKTTLVNAVTALVPLASGTITFDDRPLGRDRRLVARLGIARVFQSPTLCAELSAVENVMTAGHHRTRSGMASGLFATPRAQAEERELRAEAEGCLRRVGFQARPDADVRGLAFGALRQVEIARALMLRPRLVLFDEPTAGMASSEVQRVGQLLRELAGDEEHPIAMLLIEHNVPFVFELCDEITVLHHGRVLTGGRPEDVRAHQEVVAAYLGSEAVSESAEGEGGASAINAGAIASGLVGAPRRDGHSKGGYALRLSGVTAGYGKADVLRGVDLEVAEGELVAIFGANGAGKTTMFHAVTGLLSRVRGDILLGERQLRGRSPSRIIRWGVGFVPQEPHLLYRQTVLDNLRLAASGCHLSKSDLNTRMNSVFDLFPSLGRLRRAYASQLSGGERRMLGIGKALIRTPRVLILDEPSIGLAPTAVDAMGTAIAELNERGLTLLIAEQNARWLIPLASRQYVLDHGDLHELAGADDSLAAQYELVDRYLGASPGPRAGDRPGSARESL